MDRVQFRPDGTVRCRTTAGLIAPAARPVPGDRRASGQGKKTKLAEARMLAALAACYPGTLTTHELAGNSGCSVLLSLVQRGLVECLDGGRFRLALTPGEPRCPHCLGEVPKDGTQAARRVYCSPSCKYAFAAAAYRRRRREAEGRAKTDG